MTAPSRANSQRQPCRTATRAPDIQIRCDRLKHRAGSRRELGWLALCTPPTPLQSSARILLARLWTACPLVDCWPACGGRILRSGILHRFCGPGRMLAQPFSAAASRQLQPDLSTSFPGCVTIPRARPLPAPGLRSSGGPALRHRGCQSRHERPGKGAPPVPRPAGALAGLCAGDSR